MVGFWHIKLAWVDEMQSWSHDYVGKIKDITRYEIYLQAFYNKVEWFGFVVMMGCVMPIFWLSKMWAISFFSCL